VLYAASCIVLSADICLCIIVIKLTRRFIGLHSVTHQIWYGRPSAKQLLHELHVAQGHFSWYAASCKVIFTGVEPFPIINSKNEASMWYVYRSHLNPLC